MKITINGTEVEESRPVLRYEDIAEHVGEENPSVTVKFPGKGRSGRILFSDGHVETEEGMIISAITTDNA